MAERKTLADKLRTSREFKFETGGFTFLLRRPTELEWYDQIVGEGTTARFLPFVVGWENVREMDLLPNGEPHPLPFDPVACAEWLSDRADLYGPIIGAINDSFVNHTKEREGVTKN